MSLILTLEKTSFCICECKGAGQRAADHRLCFRYIDTCSTIPLLFKSEILSLEPSSEAVQPGLCWRWLETPKTGFVSSRLKSSLSSALNFNESCIIKKTYHQETCQIRSNCIGVLYVLNVAFSQNCCHRDINKLKS